VLPLAATVLGWVAAFVPGLGHRGGVGGTGPGASHLQHAVGIVVMTLAMMSVLAVPMVRTVAATSTWWRARRAVWLAFAGFVGTWVAVGLALHVLVETVTGVAGTPRELAAVALGAFALAQLHPRRRVEVRRCARPMPLRARGWSADADCLHLGALTGARCAQVCALPMLAMVAVPASLPLMAGLTAASLVERTYGPRRPALVAALLAAGSALTAALLLAA
jgi:hypothetical protein